MRFLKYLGRLLREFFGFAWQNKAWWIVPIVLVLLLMVLLIFAGQSTAPFIYTLFRCSNPVHLIFNPIDVAIYYTPLYISSCNHMEL